MERLKEVLSKKKKRNILFLKDLRDSGFKSFSRVKIIFLTDLDHLLQC